MTDRPTPKLTLHIEADTLPELLEMMDAVVANLSSPDDVRAVRVATDAAEMQMDLGATPKRGRGRPRKSEAQDVQPETENVEPQPEPKVAATADPAPAPTPAPAVQPVTDLSPVEARNRGIAELQQHFAQNPGALPTAMPAFAFLNKKYGVTQYSDVPDDKAHAFYADAKLLIAGALAVPADA